MSLLNHGALFYHPVIIELLHDVHLSANNWRVAAVALLGPERRRPTVFYSSSFSVWSGLVGIRAGPRWNRQCPLSHCRRAAPRQSGGNPPPRCRKGGASAGPTMSSALLLAGRGLGEAGGVLCLVVPSPRRRCRRRRRPCYEPLSPPHLLLQIEATAPPAQ